MRGSAIGTPSAASALNVVNMNQNPQLGDLQIGQLMPQPVQVTFQLISVRADRTFGVPVWWLAIEESAIWMIAERNGLAFPKLNDMCDAVVIRRETIGVA